MGPTQFFERCLNSGVLGIANCVLHGFPHQFVCLSQKLFLEEYSTT